MPRKNKSAAAKKVAQQQAQQMPLSEDPDDSDTNFYILSVQPSKKQHFPVFVAALDKLTTTEELEGDLRVMKHINISSFRHELPHVLQFCRDASEWFFNEPGVSAFVYDAISFIEMFIDELELTKQEVAHLHAICQLALIADESDLAFELVCRIIEGCGGRNALLFFSEEIRLPRPGRGHMCHMMSNIVTGKNLASYPRDISKVGKKCAWATVDDFKMVCDAVALVLMDVRSSDDTNGWCYGSALDIFSVCKWTDVACEILVEPARAAWLRYQVDDTHAGDFSDLLCKASEAKAVRKKSSANLRRLVENGSDGMEEISASDWELMWEFFMTEWTRDPRGIPSCHCVPPKPLIRCQAEYARSIREQARVSLKCARDFAKKKEHLRVIKLATGTADLLQRLQQISTGTVTNHRFRHQCGAEAKLLKGDSYTALERYSEALDCYTEIVPAVLRLPDMSANVTAAIVSAQGTKDGVPLTTVSPAVAPLARVDTLEAEALYKCALTLRYMGDDVAAFREGTLLLLCRRSAERGRDSADPKLDVWQNKAYKLLLELKDKPVVLENGAADSIALKTFGNGDILESKELAPVGNQVEKSLWTALPGILTPIHSIVAPSAGSGSSPAPVSYYLLCEYVDVVPKLGWSLLWMCKVSAQSGSGSSSSGFAEMVVWNMVHNTVVCNVSASHQSKGSQSHGVPTHCVTETKFGTLLTTTMKTGELYCFFLDSLMHVDGKKTSFDQEMVKFYADSCNGDTKFAELWQFQLGVCLEDASHILTNRNSKGQWRLAVACFEKTCDVTLYGSGVAQPPVLTAAPDHLQIASRKSLSEDWMGPFVFSCDGMKPPSKTVRGADSFVVKMVFAGDDHIVVAFGNSFVQLWSISSERCLWTIHAYNTFAQSMTLSHSFLFITPSINPYSEEAMKLFHKKNGSNGTDKHDPRSIYSQNGLHDYNTDAFVGVWSLATGQRLATLCNNASGSVSTAGDRACVLATLCAPPTKATNITPSSPSSSDVPSSSSSSRKKGYILPPNMPKHSLLAVGYESGTVITWQFDDDSYFSAATATSIAGSVTGSNSSGNSSGTVALRNGSSEVAEPHGDFIPIHTFKAMDRLIPAPWLDDFDLLLSRDVLFFVHKKGIIATAHSISRMNKLDTAADDDSFTADLQPILYDPRATAPGNDEEEEESGRDGESVVDYGEKEVVYSLFRVGVQSKIGKKSMDPTEFPVEDFPEPLLCNCAHCGKWDAVDPPAKCGQCQKAFFCNRQCQKAAWPMHKLKCKNSDVKN